MLRKYEQSIEPQTLLSRISSSDVRPATTGGQSGNCPPKNFTNVCIFQVQQHITSICPTENIKYQVVAALSDVIYGNVRISSSLRLDEIGRYYIICIYQSCATFSPEIQLLLWIDQIQKKVYLQPFPEVRMKCSLVFNLHSLQCVGT